MTHDVTDPAQAVLALFSEDMADVKFPDLDAAILTAAAEEVARARATVAAREAELEAAHDALAAKLEALHAKASRGLAYARIYAQNNLALLEKVNIISMARVTPAVAPAAASPPAKRRGRPPKSARVEAVEGVEDATSAA